MLKVSLSHTVLYQAQVFLLFAALFSVSAEADWWSDSSGPNYQPFPLDSSNPNCAGLNSKSSTGKPFQMDSATYYADRHWIPWDTKKQAAWDPSNFTDPRKFDPKNFRFIVHGLARGPGRRSAEEAYRDITSRGEEADKIRLSTSLINQDARATFSDRGFILKVPALNIVASGTEDLLSNMFNNQAVACRYRLLSPEAILTNMPTGSKVWNEVLLQGKADSPISVIGVFIVDRKKESFKNSSDFNENKEYVDEITQLARKKNLPTIYIPAPDSNEAAYAASDAPIGGGNEPSSKPIELNETKFGSEGPAL
jgi:hypothetical protein